MATCSATSPTRARPIDDPTVRGNELGGIALDYHTRRLRPGGTALPAHRPLRRAVVRRQCGGHPQPPRARATRTGRRALRADALRHPGRAGRRRAAPSTCIPAFTEHEGGSSSASSRSTSWPRSGTPTRPGSAPRRGGDRRRLGARQRPRLQRLHGSAAGRDAVHQQLPRAAWPDVLRGRRRGRLQAAPQAPLARHVQAAPTGPRTSPRSAAGARTGRPGAPSAACRRSSGSTPRPERRGVARRPCARTSRPSAGSHPLRPREELAPGAHQHGPLDEGRRQGPLARGRGSG